MQDRLLKSPNAIMQRFTKMHTVHALLCRYCSWQCMHRSWFNNAHAGAAVKSIAASCHSDLSNARLMHQKQQLTEMTVLCVMHDDMCDIIPGVSLDIGQAAGQSWRPLRHVCYDAVDAHLLAMPLTPLVAMASGIQPHHLPMYQRCACSSEALKAGAGTPLWRLTQQQAAPALCSRVNQ